MLVTGDSMAFGSIFREASEPTSNKQTNEESSWIACQKHSI